MIERMEESGPTLSAVDIQDLESRIGTRLPEEYAQFLLRNNGGRPSPNAFPIEGLANNPFGTVNFFFGIDDPVDSCNLEWNCDVMNGRLPTNLLPIADDACGDLLCLSLYGDNAGSVVFWDRHTESAEPSYRNIYRVADSFDEFLDNIRKFPS